MAVPRCPTDEELLPNPADCGTYYICLNGEAILMHCPPSLHWSIEWSRCEYPNVANCKETETTEKPPSTKPSTTKNPGEVPTKCPAENGPEDVLLPNQADCGSFFKCLDGIPHLIDCPVNQHWSVELNRCDWPEVAKCQVNKYVLKHVFATWPTECPAENGQYDYFLPNLEDCSTYYKCDHGVKYLMDCPKGTLWHAPMQRCDHAAIAVCAKPE